MRETYLLFARWTAIISIVLWTIAASFLCYWTLVRDSGNRPGSPGRSGFCLLLVGPVKCRLGQNNENAPEYKAIPGPENTLPADSGGIIQGQGHVLIGRRCPPPAESTIGPSFANM
jgi:hypothetical protein